MEDGKGRKKWSSSSSPNSNMMMSNNLPPGFRFHPTDEELIIHYLKNQATSKPCPVSIIPEVDIYKFDPWQLPEKADFGEKEWYFFTPRDRKYPNGVRPNRATVSGYWKATGTDKAIYSASRYVGIKKALVFYKGRPPKGTKTDWIMHEYRLNDASRPPLQHMKPRGSMRLDDWVLCRIYRKRHAGRTPTYGDDDQMIKEESLSLSVDDELEPSLQEAGNHVHQPHHHTHSSNQTTTTSMMMRMNDDVLDDPSKFPRTFSLSHLLDLDQYNLGPLTQILNDHHHQHHGNSNSMVPPSSSLYEYNSSSSNIIDGTSSFDSLGLAGTASQQHQPGGGGAAGLITYQQLDPNTFYKRQ